jgi:hypothetical protein
MNITIITAMMSANTNITTMAAAHAAIMTKRKKRN